jgi:hypothetical protein
MSTREWANGTGLKLNAANLNAMEADIAAAGNRRGRGFLGRSMQPATDRSVMMASVPLSNGTDTGSNSETLWPLVRDVQSVALVFGNMGDWGGSATTNSITVRASVKAMGGWTPVYFQGKRDVVLEPDGTVISDPIGAPYAAGDLLPVRTYVTVASGQKWPNTTLTDNNKGEAVANSTTPTDLTTSGTIAAARAYAYAPLTVVADPGSSRTVVGVGDSILQQQHDAINTDWSVTSTLQWGFLRRFAYTNRLPLFNLGVIGDTAMDYAALSGRKYAFRRGVSADGAVAVVNFGRNDLDKSRTLAQIQADLTTVWTQLTRLGIKVYQCTVCPRTSSTDSWITTASQTVAETEAIRVQLNDWIRTKPAPLTGYFETADAVETARNSGIWKAAQRIVVDAAMTAGSAALNTASGGFSSADIGTPVAVRGAGASGADLKTYITATPSATQATLAVAAGTDVTAATAGIGTYTDDGIHPVSIGHIAMAGALTTDALKIG